MTQQTAQTNLIAGGNFDENPWSAGTSFVSPVPNLAITADGWSWGQSGAGAISVEQAALAPTVAQAGIYSATCFESAVTVVDSSITTGEYYFHEYVMSGYNFATIAQQAFTLSFWHKHISTNADTYCVSLRNSGSDRSYVATYTQTTNDTWEYVSLTIPASPSAGTWNYTSGVGLVISFAIAVGATYQTTAGSWNNGNFLGTSGQCNGMASTANRFRIQLVSVRAGTQAFPWNIRNYVSDIIISNPYAYGGALRNLIYGGNFDSNAWTRGTSYPSTANATPVADGWRWTTVGAGVVDITRATDAPTVAQSGIYSTTCLRATVTTGSGALGAGHVYYFTYNMEGYVFKQLAQNTMYLSFWHKHTVVGTYSVLFTNGVDRSCGVTYTQTTTNVWEFAQIAVPASPSAGTWNYTTSAGIQLFFGLATGSTFATATPYTWTSTFPRVVSSQVNNMLTIGNIFSLQFVQLTAYPTLLFDRRSDTEEQYLQARYCVKTFPRGTTPANAVGIQTGEVYGPILSAGNNWIFWRYPTPMIESAGTPTLTLYNPVNNNAKIYDQTAAIDLSTASLTPGSNYSAVIKYTGTGASLGDSACIHVLADKSL